MTATIIRAERLTSGYDKFTVFSDLSTTIQKGKITTIIGPNGCGKSTLLKTVGRILKQQSGKVLLQEQDMKSISTREIAKQLALLSQNPEAPLQLKVEELISYGRFPQRKNTGALSKKDMEVIEWAMEITKTTAFRDREIAQLSGGQRQKVWLAMALAQETSILLLDEPTTYLDLAHQLEVLKIVERLNREHHCTIVMVLHDINHAARFSHHIIAMRDGEIVTTGSPEEILEKEVLKKVFHIDARIMIDPENGSPVCFGYDALLEEAEAR
ncbi:ABC transporter ATP-binding protein [Sporosarcina sp. ACRSM]|uniref:ABC transporter ATP-binding protein n=1 Tax=Sporosarcina sp. ACRSM TaxID=2918216 RepID=UPI001EF57FEE|nr:ABC transporter ATP-binding protein [Sporosarcina sp. ACRSM]MCG7335510.1 ABC transporter ATP-binding protein [Sporosarcina sp. ACRSM]